jgi:predicted dehydrogenase
MRFMTRRDFLRTGLAAGAAVAVPAASGRAAGANEAIRLGFIGCGGRGNVLLSHFARIEGVRIGGLCDPDQRRLHSAGERFANAKRWADLREMLDDDSIDAVVIASAVHWHALATIWAVQAGKDVYCEKPMSHNLREARLAAAAVEKSGRIWQHGTQQQSDPMRADIRRFLHDERALGKVLSVRANRYDVRPPIGKRDAPLSIPGHIDYNLWLGPAQDMPVYRNNLQYDWHWDWNTGAGEMGNWGIHILDDVRNNVLPDKVMRCRGAFAAEADAWCLAMRARRRTSTSSISTRAPYRSFWDCRTFRPSPARGAHRRIPARPAVTSLIARAAGWKR